jgi:hypothetical protein
MRSTSVRPPLVEDEHGVIRVTGTRVQLETVVTHDRSTLIGSAYDLIRASKPMSGVIAAVQSVGIGVAIDDLELMAACSNLEEWRARVSYLLGPPEPGRACGPHRCADGCRLEKPILQAGAGKATREPARQRMNVSSYFGTYGGGAGNRAVAYVERSGRHAPRWTALRAARRPMTKPTLPPPGRAESVEAPGIEPNQALEWSRDGNRGRTDARAPIRVRCSRT